MARKEMQRTFVTTEVDFSEVVNNNGDIDVVKKDPIQLGGKLDETQAAKALNRLEEYKNKNVIVTSVKHSEALYTMPVERFLELADKQTESQEQTELELAEQK